LILWVFGLCHFTGWGDGIWVKFCRGFGGDMFGNQKILKDLAWHQSQILYLESKINHLLKYLNLKEIDKSIPFSYDWSPTLICEGYQKIEKTEKCEHCGQQVKNDSNQN
jgi:hypothetical protein